MHRQVQDRVERVAPFLVFDEDPYIVAVDGRLHWIIDAYTSSSYFPYSQPFASDEHIEVRDGDVGERTVRRLNGENYVRASVKAVVDAYNGSVDFYVFEPDDPIIGAPSRTARCARVIADRDRRAAVDRDLHQLAAGKEPDPAAVG